MGYREELFLFYRCHRAMLRARLGNCASVGT